MLQKLAILVCILSKNYEYRFKLLQNKKIKRRQFLRHSVYRLLRKICTWTSSETLVYFRPILHLQSSCCFFIFTTLPSVILFLWIGALWIFICLHHYMLHLALSWNTQMRRVLQYSGFPMATWSAATFLGIVK